MKKKAYFILLLLVFPIVAVFAQTKESDAIVGIWLNEKESAKIKIFLSSTGEYYGDIIWLKNPLDTDGKPRLDKHNSDDKLKNKPLQGLMILRGFQYKGDGLWEEGKIYDPNTGFDYSCRMRLKEPNVLDVHGYIGISILGRSEIWKRTE